MRIYTLGYLKEEAEAIAGHWNGSDEKFVDGNGDGRDAEEAEAASELLTKIKEVEALIEELSI